MGPSFGRHFFRRAPVRVAIALTMFAGAAAKAGPVIWDLEGAAFTDGALGTGYFVFDAASTKLSDWRIATGPSEVSPFFSDFLYTPLTSIAVANSGGCGIDFLAFSGLSRTLCLNPASPLIAGATPALLLTSNESSSSGRRFLSAGGLEDPPPGGGDTVPEPATAVSVGGAIAAAFLILRRRSKPRDPN